jgi:hypothetical protein
MDAHITRPLRGKRSPNTRKGLGLSNSEEDRKIEDRNIGHEWGSDEAMKG